MNAGVGDRLRVRVSALPQSKGIESTPQRCSSPVQKIINPSTAGCGERFTITKERVRRPTQDAQTVAKSGSNSTMVIGLKRFQFEFQFLN